MNSEVLNVKSNCDFNKNNKCAYDHEKHAYRQNNRKIVENQPHTHIAYSEIYLSQYTHRTNDGK